jgi:thiamine-monophosphate kinase
MSIFSTEKSEFEFISHIRNKYALSKVGDDCAVLPKDSRTDLVITTDLLVEDIDFRLTWINPELLGHKSLAVSLSDVAAMGATPLYSLVSIGVPPKVWKTDFVEKFYSGYMHLAKKFNIELIGGDVSKTTDKIVIDSVCLGKVRKGKAVLRSGAKVGDLIYVTGKLGGAALALKMLEGGEIYPKPELADLLLRQLAPNPQVEIGKIIGAKGLATAMIDLSDGLSSDIRHICLASGVGARIFADQIPFDSEISRSQLQTSQKLQLALSGGEDYELLFTVSPKKISKLEKELKNHLISKIGEITATVGMVEFITNQKSIRLKPEGYSHF